MQRRHLASLALSALAWAALPAVATTALPAVEVYKSPYCGCCGAWAEHMKAAGFAVNVHLVDDTTAMRKRLGLPDTYGSCHTALVGGYAVEGHVPAGEVKRLLAARPRAVGLAVPSMPPGSPGMEAGGRVMPYEVLLVRADGSAETFARYPKR
jgi:hypothetical protein